MILSGFLQNNIFYIVLGIILTFVLFVLTLLIIKLYLDISKEKELAKKDNPKFNDVISSLGGVDNIVNVDAKKGRIVFKVQDEGKIKELNFEKLGMTLIGHSLILEPLEVNRLVFYIDERKK
ncbi:MAG: hypothetical protein HUJ61_01760 [Bacilli bacterium]|nr:hypothetical protein [Bacilli bacterium]